MDNSTDPQWDSAYGQVYTFPGLALPWYAVLGNHDYHRNPQAQIDYYHEQRDRRWIMPSHLFHAIYRLPQSEETLEVIFLDTALLATEETEQTAPGGIHEVSPHQKAAYLRQVESLLKRSQARWLLLAGHYTLFSMAWHGDNAALIDCLLPLIRRYRVQAYMHGHDHVLQHIDWQGVTILTSGRGALTNNWPPDEWQDAAHNSQAKAGLRFVTSQPGFAGASVSKDTLEVTFLSQHGEILHQLTLTNPRTPADRQQIHDSDKTYDDLPFLYFSCVFVGLIVGCVLGHYFGQKENQLFCASCWRTLWSSCEERFLGRRSLASQADEINEEKSYTLNNSRSKQSVQDGEAEDGEVKEVELQEMVPVKVHPRASQYSAVRQPVNEEDGDEESFDL